MEVDCPSSQGSFQNSSGLFPNRWKSLFDLLAEIELPQPNHLRSAINCNNTLSLICVFSGRLFLPLLAHQAGAVSDPI